MSSLFGLKQYPYSIIKKTTGIFGRGCEQKTSTLTSDFKINVRRCQAEDEDGRRRRRPHNVLMLAIHSFNICTIFSGRYFSFRPCARESSSRMFPMHPVIEWENDQ